MTICSLALLLATHTSHAQSPARSWTIVGESFDAATIEHEGAGRTILVQPFGRTDTLRLYVQSVSLMHGPDRHAAKDADLVAWCYPERYPDPRHVLPHKERIVIVSARHTGRPVVAVGTPRYLDQLLPTGGYTPTPLHDDP